jgi:hypothetical protein
MFIELVDALRCLNPHEESWLVAAVERFEGRYIDRGSLGCPICRAEYRIESGVADFRGGATAHVTASVPGLAGTGDVADEILRVRALLDLSEPGGTIALAGSAAALAAQLEDAIDVTVLVINPDMSTEQRAGRSTLLVSDRVPLARASLRGVVIGADQATTPMLTGLAAALQVGSRLLAPVDATLPFGMEELARDDRQWVAMKRDALSAPVTLDRRRRS